MVVTSTVLEHPQRGLAKGGMSNQKDTINLRVASKERFNMSQR